MLPLKQITTLESNAMRIGPERLTIMTMMQKTNASENTTRYAFLFQLDITDYEGWAKGLKKAGYATNPQYAERLIKIIEDNKLFKLERGNSSDYVASSDKDAPPVILSSGVKSSLSPC